MRQGKSPNRTNFSGMSTFGIRRAARLAYTIIVVGCQLRTIRRIFQRKNHPEGVNCLLFLTELAGVLRHLFPTTGQVV